MLERHCPKGARDRSGGSVQATRLNKLPGSHVLLKGTSSDIDMLENISARCGAHGGSTHNSPTPWCRTRRAPYTSCQWYWQRAYRRQV